MRFFFFMLGLSLGLLLFPGTLRSQPLGVAVGGGLGITQSQDISGRGYHGQFSFPVYRLDERFSIRGELFYQQGTLSGSPFSCEQVVSGFCFGRTDENQIFGGTAYLRVRFPTFLDVFHPYLTPIGVGLYHRRTETSETEGLSDGTFQRFTEREEVTAVGWNTGAGLAASVLGAGVFLEVRLHDILEPDESIAGALPLSFGISL